MGKNLRYLQNSIVWRLYKFAKGAQAHPFLIEKQSFHRYWRLDTAKVGSFSEDMA